MSARDGSSPRVRGKLATWFLLSRVLGLIPARAGKTAMGWPTAAQIWAHPRACGENLLCRVHGHVWRGSSPRVRGKRLVAPAAEHAPGLIPACAGKPHAAEGVGGVGEAHPRVCGENAGKALYDLGATGSSPRVRGKPAGWGAARACAGLIPARAGKTPATPAPTGARRAHPRTCGENPDSHRDSGPHGGSSPRVRGKRALRLEHRARIRLIPARAGKT